MSNLESNKFNNSEYLSDQGLKKLQKELDYLKKQRRKEITERLQYALSLGDISENTEYQNAKDDQVMTESRIASIEDILSRAVLISKENNFEVQIGSVVSVKQDGGDKVEEYFIVGPEEADPSSRKISHESPLGKIMIGRKKGETVEVLTPKKKINYTIIDIG